MTRKLFIASVVLLVVGNVGRIYANNYSHVDAQGILRDTAWMPISTTMLLLGLVLVIGSAITYGKDRLQLRN